MSKLTNPCFTASLPFRAKCFELSHVRDIAIEVLCIIIIIIVPESNWQTHVSQPASTEISSVRSWIFLELTNTIPPHPSFTHLSEHVILNGHTVCKHQDFRSRSDHLQNFQCLRFLEFPCVASPRFSFKIRSSAELPVLRMCRTSMPRIYSE